MAVRFCNACKKQITDAAKCVWCMTCQGVPYCNVMCRLRDVEHTLQCSIARSAAPAPSGAGGIFGPIASSGARDARVVSSKKRTSESLLFQYQPSLSSSSPSPSAAVAAWAPLMPPSSQGPPPPQGSPPGAGAGAASMATMPAMSMSVDAADAVDLIEQLSKMRRRRYQRAPLGGRAPQRAYDSDDDSDSDDGDDDDGDSATWYETLKKVALPPACQTLAERNPLPGDGAVTQRQGVYYVGGAAATSSAARLLRGAVPDNMAVRVARVPKAAGAAKSRAAATAGVTGRTLYAGLFSKIFRRFAALALNECALPDDEYARFIVNSSTWASFQLFRMANVPERLTVLRTQLNVAYTNAAGARIVGRVDVVYRRPGWPPRAVGLMTVAPEPEALVADDDFAARRGAAPIRNTPYAGHALLLHMYAAMFRRAAKAAATTAAAAVADKNAIEAPYKVRELTLLELPVVLTDPMQIATAADVEALERQQDRRDVLHVVPLDDDVLRRTARDLLRSAESRGVISEEDMFNT